MSKRHGGKEEWLKVRCCTGRMAGEEDGFSGPLAALCTRSGAAGGRRCCVNEGGTLREDFVCLRVGYASWGVAMRCGRCEWFWAKAVP
jgi:hypothetical protein